MNLTFLGAAGTVTGSKYLIETDGIRILVDCGLFQGLKPLRLKNWEPLPFEVSSLDAVVLTHAHLDHSGYLPLLVKRGFRGPIFCSESTTRLCEILLPDSGFLQEKDAEFANRHGFSKHKPALPLYTQQEAIHALDFFRPLAFDGQHEIRPAAKLMLRRAGHILGAASVELQINGKTVVFSGDIGRYDDPILPDPAPVPSADYLIVESTYGDRVHDRVEPSRAIGDVIARTVGRGGTVVIPAFAVGRVQGLLFFLQKLKAAGELANVPIFLDSPMAVDATELYCSRGEDHKLSRADCASACSVASYVHSVEDSKALTNNPVPKIIISASGMATGGRVLHHLKHYASDPRSTLLFAGFQAPGTRGAALVAGADSIKIHGEQIPVRAEVQNLSMLSAHADREEILRWLADFRQPPRTTFVTHGEPAAADALSRLIAERLGWRVRVPRDLDVETL